MMGRLSFAILKLKGGAMGKNKRERVLSKYPQAVAEFHKAVYEVGHSEAKFTAHWTLMSAASDGFVLGIGINEDAAWDDAGKSLKID
jgi:hypothetical protein